MNRGGAGAAPPFRGTKAATGGVPQSVETTAGGVAMGYPILQGANPINTLATSDEYRPQ
jgi:hypothetical protein